MKLLSGFPTKAQVAENLKFIILMLMLAQHCNGDWTST